MDSDSRQEVVVQLLVVLLERLQSPSVIHVGRDGDTFLQALRTCGAAPVTAIDPPSTTTCSTLDSLVSDQSLPAETGALVIAAGTDSFSILKGMGRLRAAIVLLDYWGDVPTVNAPPPYRVRDVTRWMRERGFSNFALFNRTHAPQLIQINNAHTGSEDRGNIVFLRDSLAPDVLEALVRTATDAQSNLLVDVMQRQTRILERLEARLDTADWLGRVDELDRQRLEAEATASARLAVIDGLQHALERERFWSWGQRLRRSWSPKLGVLYQHPPRPLEIPAGYIQRHVQPAGMPTVSIVTPSLNQGAFIERTILSVLDQHYANLEYIIQDANSSDGTQEILQRYAAVLGHVEWRRDDGLAHGLNLGFSHSTGAIMAYLNSDDILLPGTLPYVAHHFAKHPEIDVVYGHRIVIDEYDAEIGRWILPEHNDNVLSWADYVPQETLFWRRSVWDKAGGIVDESFQFAIDWDLLLRFREVGARFARLPRFLGAFRVHPHQKTSTAMEQIGQHEMAQLRQRCHGRRVTTEEVARAIRPYLRRHLLLHKLYRLGIMRY